MTRRLSPLSFGNFLALGRKANATMKIGSLGFSGPNPSLAVPEPVLELAPPAFLFQSTRTAPHLRRHSLGYHTRRHPPVANALTLVGPADPRKLGRLA